MKKSVLTIAFGMGLTLSPHTGLSKPKFELGATGGVHMFAKDVELGVADSSAMTSPNSTPLLGGRAALVLPSGLGVEAELVYGPTHDRMFDTSTTILAYRASLQYRLRQDKQVRPFLFAGIGSMMVRPDSENPLMKNDSDLTFQGGAGLLFAVSGSWDFRIDAKEVMLPDVNHSGATFDLELTAGATFRFGGSQERGLPADDFSTGEKAEQSIEESLLGEEPISAQADAKGENGEEGKTSAEPAAEQMDDKDRDGLVDAIDDCPTKAETANDFEDDDGCPDELMAGLDGIEFRTGSADLTADSLPVLQRAAEVLKKNPNAKVTIEGHTSSEGSHDKNRALSKARAHTVLKYMLTQGIPNQQLKAVGLGDTRPKASNRSHDGRVQNRRIEFRILSR